MNKKVIASSVKIYKKDHYTNHIHVTRMIQFLARRILLTGFVPDHIIGIAKGGLQISETLAEFFGIDVISVKIQRPLSVRTNQSQIIDINSFEKEYFKQQPILVHPLPTPIGPGAKYLIVDNIVVTGGTLRVLKNALLERGVPLVDVRIATYSDVEIPSEEKLEKADFFCETSNYSSIWSDRANMQGKFLWYRWLKNRNMEDFNSFVWAHFKPGKEPTYNRWTLYKF